MNLKAKIIDQIDYSVQEEKNTLKQACKNQGISVTTYQKHKAELKEILDLYQEIKLLKTEIEKLKQDKENLQRVVDTQRNKSKINENYSEMEKKVQRYEQFILKYIVGED